MASMVIETGTPALETQATCECGQALDCCHRQHCPRCGVTLHA